MFRGSRIVTNPLPINNPTNKSLGAFEVIMINACPIFGFFFSCDDNMVTYVGLFNIVLLGDTFKDYFRALCKPRMLQKT